jgi:hypothetical protein
VLAGDCVHVCASTGIYGKLVALQRKIGQRIARGALREGGPDLASSMTPNVYSASDILLSPVRHLEREAVYPQYRTPRSCRMLDTDFGECTTGEVRRTPPPRAWVGRTGRKSRHRLGASPWPLRHGGCPSPSATGAVGLPGGGDPILFVHRPAAVCLLHTRLGHVHPTKPVGLAYIHLWSTSCLMIAILPRLSRPGR